MKIKDNFVKGIFKENPIFITVLGMCPTLAVTNSVESAIGMGISVIFVLTLSNIIISLIRKIVPNEIRIPAYIVVIASLVTILDMVLAAYLQPLSAALGIFIPLIVVNCLILGRAEAFASKNNVFDSIIDALGMGLGFTLALTLIASVREILGNGYITLVDQTKDFFGVTNNIIVQIIPENFFYEPANMFVQNVGAFLVLGLLMGIINSIVIKRKNNKLKPKKAEVSA